MLNNTLISKMLSKSSAKQFWEMLNNAHQQPTNKENKQLFIPNNDNNFTAVYFDLIEREDEKIRVDFYTATPLGFMLGDNGLEVIAPPLIDD